MCFLPFHLNLDPLFLTIQARRHQFLSGGGGTKKFMKWMELSPTMVGRGRNFLVFIAFKRPQTHTLNLFLAIKCRNVHLYLFSFFVNGDVKLTTLENSKTYSEKCNDVNYVSQKKNLLCKKVGGTCPPAPGVVGPA